MRSLFICAAVLASAAALPAAAKDEARLPADAVTVQYTDLELSNPADRAELNQRVDRAIAQVCRRRFRSPLEDLAACRTALREHVVEQSSGAVRSALTNPGMATATASQSRQ
jgi:UrcA family protein